MWTELHIDFVFQVSQRAIVLSCIENDKICLMHAIWTGLVEFWTRSPDPSECFPRAFGVCNMCNLSEPTRLPLSSYCTLAHITNCKSNFIALRQHITTRQMYNLWRTNTRVEQSVSTQVRWSICCTWYMRDETFWRTALASTHNSQPALCIKIYIRTVKSFWGMNSDSLMKNTNFWIICAVDSWTELCF